MRSSQVHQRGAPEAHAPGAGARAAGLDEAGLSAVLSDLAARPAAERMVEGFAWASFPIWNVDPPVLTARLANFAGWPREFPLELISLSENYLAVTHGRYTATRAADRCAAAGCLAALTQRPYSESLFPSPAGTRLAGGAALSGFRPPFWCRLDPAAPQCREPPPPPPPLAFEALLSASLLPAIGAVPGTPLQVTPTLACARCRAPHAEFRHPRE